MAQRAREGTPWRTRDPIQNDREGAEIGVATRRRQRFQAQDQVRNPMDLLTSPSRGIDSVVTTSMMGMQDSATESSMKYVCELTYL